SCCRSPRKAGWISGRVISGRSRRCARGPRRYRQNSRAVPRRHSTAEPGPSQARKKAKMAGRKSKGLPVPLPSPGPRCYSRSMSDLQSQIEACGEEIFALVDAQKKLPDAINPAVWYGRLMEWTMGKENLKVQTLRFVDTLPVLNSTRALNAHMHEYFGDPSLELAGPLKIGLGLSSLAPWLVGPVVRTGVKRMARSFITGRTGAEAVRELRKIRSRKVAFTVDILGEAVVSEREADEYQARYMELIESLAAEAKNWPPIEQLEGAGSGPRPVPAVNVSVKIS